MTERFPGVRAAFEENLAGGEDLGASFCVTVDGETVVDLWGGYADEARTRSWCDGSLAIIDMDARTSIGYAMNKMSGTTTRDLRAFGLAMAFWEAA